MSREIKFRAWDAANERFWAACIWNGKDWALRDDCPTGFPITQYTGLKDKNGAEIYEGDIFDKETGDDYYGFVEWDNDHWAINWGGGEKDAFSDYHMNGFLIIGNIYQTPELLNPSS